MADIKRFITQGISLNSGGFSSPEVEALHRVLFRLVDEIEELEDRIEQIEEGAETP